MLTTHQIKRLVVNFASFALLCYYMPLALSQQLSVENKENSPSISKIKKAGKESTLKERLLWHAEFQIRRGGVSNREILPLLVEPVFENLGAEGYRVELFGCTSFGTKYDVKYDLEEQLTEYSINGVEFQPLTSGVEITERKGESEILVRLEGKGWTGNSFVNDANGSRLYQAELKVDYATDSYEVFRFSIDSKILAHSKFFFRPANPVDGNPIRYLDPDMLLDN